jgi:hypothetical protein
VIGWQCTTLNYPPSAYITTLLVPRNGEIEIKISQLEHLGIKVNVVRMDVNQM